MKADEAADMMDKDKEQNQFKKRAAMGIAVLAMLLAITGLGGNNATKEALNENILAANFFNFFQAKNVRQTAYILAADELELAWVNDPHAAARGEGGIARQGRRLQEDDRALQIRAGDE